MSNTLNTLKVNIEVSKAKIMHIESELKEEKRVLAILVDIQGLLEGELDDEFKPESD